MFLTARTARLLDWCQDRAVEVSWAGAVALHEIHVGPSSAVQDKLGLVGYITPKDAYCYLFFPLANSSEAVS